MRVSDSWNEHENVMQLAEAALKKAVRDSSFRFKHQTRV